MVIAIGILLAFLCAAVLSIPILRSRHTKQVVSPIDMIEGLTQQRQGIYRELLTLKEGLQMGNVSQGEYEAVSQNLRRRAAEKMLVQRRWEHRLKALDQALERQVSDLVSSLETSSETVTCPECGNAAPSSQSDCSVCGASLAQSSEAATQGAEH